MQKATQKTFRVPAKMSAAAAGVSEVLVLKARAGKRITGKKAKRVLLADEHLGAGMSKLVEEVRRLVTFEEVQDAVK